MKKLRLLLLPVGAVAELFVLVVCWIIALISPALAKRVMERATNTLPTLYWYIDE